MGYVVAVGFCVAIFHYFGRFGLYLQIVKLNQGYVGDLAYIFMILEYSGLICGSLVEMSWFS
jgi:hypothetical protein